jgi:hypothetical protein
MHIGARNPHRHDSEIRFKQGVTSRFFQKGNMKYHPLALAALLLCECAVFSQTPGYLPGQRVLMDAHNCYPYEGKWMDRVDRALASSLPVGIEMDLIWDATKPESPRVVVSHGVKATGDEPAFKDYFFEKIRPVVEKALQNTNKTHWPLITLNINDLRTDAPEFYTALWNLIQEYESWICTAPRTSDMSEAAPIDLKPVLILTSDGPRQRKVFYDSVPVGKRLFLFAAGRPDQKADNFHRWLNYSWKSVEPEGQNKAGDWSADDGARLKSLVQHAHEQSYWIRFYTLDGATPLEMASNGWLSIYNFSSLEAVTLRWKAARYAGVDFVASDQYSECAEVLRGK